MTGALGRPKYRTRPWENIDKTSAQGQKRTSAVECSKSALGSIADTSKCRPLPRDTATTELPMNPVEAGQLGPTAGCKFTSRAPQRSTVSATLRAPLSVNPSADRRDNDRP